MNTLVISDTHLGKYDKEKDQFLKNLIEKYDRIIINGDFWDSWGTSLGDFVNSEYKNLLDLLKSKEKVYIYGNHDYRAENQRELSKICSNIQGIEYKLTIGDKDFHFEHGHRFFSKQKNPLLINYYYIIDKIPLLGRLVFKIINMSYRVYPRRIKENRIGRKRNDFIKSIKSKDEYYVVSHTHLPEIDEENKFVNTGCLVEDYFSYLVIDDRGNVRLIEKEF
jgi:predicted phosphodiesterase